MTEEAQAQDAGAAATPAPEASAPEADATPAAEAQAPEAEQSQQAEAEESSNTEPSPTEISIEPPEGMDAYKADFDAFNTDVNGWLKENPDATAADALKWAAERQSKLVAEQTAAAEKQGNQVIQEWETQAKSDPELGKNWDATVSRAQLAADKLGTPELRQALDASGLGSHPEFIRFAARMGKALEEAPTLAPAGAGAKASLANRIYADS